MYPFAKNVLVTLSPPDLDLSHAQKDKQIGSLFGQLQAHIDQQAVLPERIKALEDRLALNDRPGPARRGSQSIGGAFFAGSSHWA